MKRQLMTAIAALFSLALTACNDVYARCQREYPNDPKAENVCVKTQQAENIRNGRPPSE